jgi:hypothetical protein
MSDKKGPAGNANVSWSHFDPETYFQQYYGEPHPDDEGVVRHSCAALSAAMPKGNDLNIVDVGTGPNLFPLFCAMPRAATITAWEYERRNVDWLRAELAVEPLRPQWQQFWKVAVDAYGPGFDLPENPIPTLRQKADIQQGSVYDLPERRWDAATMFFCAESITEKYSEFEAACVRFARAVRPGGSLVAAFLAGSSGYAVADRPFPALKVSEADIQRVFGPVSAEAKTVNIGISEREIRSGYSGMVFLTAKAI